MSAPQIGDKVRFIPEASFDHSAGFADILMQEVTGTVIQVNEQNRWYRVEYQTNKPGCIGHETFKY